MAIAFVRNSGTAKGEASLGGELNVTVEKGSVGNRWIVAIATAGNIEIKQPTGISDAALDTFVLDGAISDGTTLNVSIWSGEIKSGSTTELQIKGLRAAAITEVTVSEWSGIQKSGTYIRTTSTGASGVGTEAEAGTLSASPKPTDLVFAAFGATSLSTFTPVAPYKALTGEDQTGGSVGAEYNLETEATTAPKATLSLTGTWTGKAVVYKTALTVNPLKAGLTFIGTLKRKTLNKFRAIFYLQNFPANEILNPSFEYDVVGATPAWWKESVTGAPTEKTFLVSEAWSAIGKNSLKIAATLNGSAGEQRIGAISPAGNAAPARTKSGETWNATAVVNVISIPAHMGVTVELAFRSEEPAIHYLGTGGGATSTILTTGEHIVEISGVAPKESFECDLFLYGKTTSTEANGHIEYYIDKIGVRRSTGYADGDLIGYSWAGKPGNSITDSRLPLGEKTIHKLSSSLSSLGLFDRNILRQLTATLTPSGMLQRIIGHLLAVTLSFLGSLRSMAIKNFEASLVLIGLIQRRITHALTALLTLSTQLLDYIIYRFMASLSFVGTLPRRFEFIKSFTASLGVGGTLQRYVALTQTAELHSVGSLGSGITRRLSAALTFAGFLPRNILRRISPTLGPEGSLDRNISHALAGKLTFIGSITFRTIHMLSGVVSFTGSIASRTTTRVQSAALSFSGSIRSGAIKNFEAALSTAGGLRRNVVYILSAKLTFLGLIKFGGDFVHRIVASVNFSGVLPHSTRRTLAASAGFSGSLERSLVYRLKAALGTIGTLQKVALHKLVGALTFSGKTPRIISQRLTASLGVIGTLPKVISHRLRAMLEFVGFLESHLIILPVHPVTPVFLRSIDGPDKLTYHLSIPTLTLQTPRIVPDELVRSELASYITERSPSNFEKYVVSPKAHLRLANGQTKPSINSMLATVSSTLAKRRNRTVLVAYDQDHNPIEVSESYYDD